MDATIRNAIRRVVTSAPAVAGERATPRETRVLFVQAVKYLTANEILPS